MQTPGQRFAPWALGVQELDTHSSWAQMSPEPPGQCSVPLGWEPRLPCAWGWPWGGLDGGRRGILAQFNNSTALWEPEMCLTYIEPRALRAQSIHWQQRGHSVGEDLPPCSQPGSPLGATGAGSTGAVLGEGPRQQLLLHAVPASLSCVLHAQQPWHSVTRPLDTYFGLFSCFCASGRERCCVVCALRTPLSDAHKGLAAGKSKGAQLGSAAPFTSPDGAC